MRLLGTRILFKEASEQRKTSLIELPPENKPIQTGQIVFIGDKTELSKKGELYKDKFIYIHRSKSEPIDWEGQSLYLCSESDILGIEL